MIKSNTIRQLFIITLIFLIGVLILRKMLPYLSGILGAIVLYVLLKNYMSKLAKRGWNLTLAALTLMLLSFITITIPVVGVIILIGDKIKKTFTNSEVIVASVKEEVKNIESYLNIELSSVVNIESIGNWLPEQSKAFMGSSFDSFIALMLMYFILFYMLTNQQSLKASLLKYIPIKESNLKLMGTEVYEMVKSNALGIPLVAIAQGVVSLVGFMIFDVSNPFFWALMVTIGSMIPFVGNLLGTLPVFILSLVSGNSFQAWGVLLYGILVVGLTDNVIRLYVLKKLDNVHPLITLIGVLIGIPLFGFIGLIFGPLLVSIFLLILSIYKKEFA